MSARYDVVVLGGGMAALSLTRLLQRVCPEASVLTLDRAGPERRRQVGESTVEIGARFLTERLGLTDLVRRTQLPKNGLRFWFDDAERSLSFADSSEDGPGAYSFWRTVQIERNVFERDLRELNVAGGAEHLTGVRVEDVHPGAGDDAHRVRYRRGGESHEVEARWLVDGSGIASVLGRKTGNLEPEERLTHSACWTWFEGAKQIDDLVPEGRARFSAGRRCLSTNMLLYEGYWIWLIPLASGLLSVGLCYDHTIVQDPPRDQEAFLAFLRSHRKLMDLLEEATPVDFGVYKNFSYRPKRYLTTDRIAYLGQAAGFVDPFFSNGLDLIAIGCESLADLVRRDLAGEALDANRARLYERTLELTHEHFVLSVAGLLETFVSAELSQVRYRRDIHLYWNLLTWPYLSRRLLDVEFLPGFHQLVEESQRRTGFFVDLLRHARDTLAGRGLLYRDNHKRYTFNQLGFRNVAYVRFEQQLSSPMDLARSRRAQEEIDVGCFLALLDALFDADRSPVRGLLFDAADAAFPELLDLHGREGELSAAFWEQAWKVLESSLRQRLAKDGIELGEWTLTAEGYRRLLADLEGAAPDHAAEIRRLMNQQPRLGTFSDLPPGERGAPGWDAPSPWLEPDPEFPTVYDIRGEAWWEGEPAPGRPGVPQS